MGYLPVFSSADTRPCARKGLVSRLMKPLVLSALLAAASLAHAAQPANQITASVDLTQVRALPNHHPLWANAANDAGLTPADLPLENMTLVLARSPQQEAAFAQLLADQQNPASANYHHWLTPAEVGERFGLSAQDIDTLSSWLQSQGLHVNWVAPSRTFIGFGGTAANLGRAFQTELHYYNVNGVKRMSVASDPMIPQALAPAIKAIRGLYTLEEQPYYHAAVAQAVSPQMTASSGNHYIAPIDFQTIYDLPLSYSGYGKTIGIVGRARTNVADFDNFRQKTMNGFQNPTEVVPTAFGGIDPGPALTAPPAVGVSIGEQGEATLDVLRAGSVAPNANLLLVVASATSDGIGADVQYLVQTSPVPAQVMTISFGACELAAGTGAVNYWDTLFQQAAAEGISVFVSSGDAGASGCDSNFSTPPAAPKANSPNYLCSSSYATCVGGTEFNDTSNPTLYWNTSSSSALASARSYIPEGGWNEPLNSNSLPVAASSGGGVSTIIATPSWQTGTGVPVARSGRYTPDISFSSSCHDGYFGCFAAGGASCVSDSTGKYYFSGFCGTSAAAPSMAGVTALLDEKFGRGLGNLNPAFYQLAASAPAAFHDVTVATSGVASCDVNTPTMCNNSIPSSTGLSGGQAGFLVTAGYDEVTGLGSLDLQKFFDNYSAPKLTPTLAVTLSSSSITTAQALTVTVALTASDTITPSGSVTLTSGSYTSAASTVFNGSATINVPANSLAAGTATLTVSYTPDSSGASIYSSASGSNTITVTAVAKITPTMTVTPSSSSITSAQGLTVVIAVNGGSGNQTPTGTVTLSSGSYTSAAATLTSGSATVNVLAGMLAVGNDTLTVSYTPDATSTSIYNTASGSSSVTVTAVAKITPTVTVSPYPLSATTDQTLTVSIAVSGGSGNQTPTGTVKLTAGSYVVSGALNGGSAFLILSAGALPAGSDTLAVSYTPDTASSLVYNSATGSSTVTITRFTPTVQVAPAMSSITTAQALSVTVTASGGYYLASPSGSVILSSGSYTSAAAAFPSGGATIIVPAGALATGTDTLTGTYTPDATSSPLYNGATSTATVTVTAVPPPTPTFTVSSSSLTLTAGATTGNTATITVTPSGGFTGSVALTATVSPANGTYPPTLSFGTTSPVSITGTSAGTATLTIATTASQTPSCTADNRLQRGIPWYAEGGTALALVLLFGIPARRRKWRNLLGMVALAVALVSGVASCGGGGGGTKACPTYVLPGTTAGAYTVTVTGTGTDIGTSTTIVATGAISLTVQ
ncbi:MAG: protease pro-enzyme activation domain-containing protein [Terracidiphilus sp.]|nr:protease pro-enzyme activation domain-containing protein [Terracidiphilus sp.]MDR3776261.1 protease pro-enzyme activation domain-containing protein [Terracidiphilus sp.]